MYRTCSEPCHLSLADCRYAGVHGFIRHRALVAQVECTNALISGFGLGFRGFKGDYKIRLIGSINIETLILKYRLNVVA